MSDKKTKHKESQVEWKSDSSQILKVKETIEKRDKSKK